VVVGKPLDDAIRVLGIDLTDFLRGKSVPERINASTL